VQNTSFQVFVVAPRFEDGSELNDDSASAPPFTKGDKLEISNPATGDRQQNRGL
jgi:hypothetical protein